MIQIKKTSKNATLKITLGDESTTIHNIPLRMAERYAIRKVASFIKKYVNHRRQIIMYHGGLYNHEKVMALDRLTYKVNGSERWKFQHLPRIIQSMENDLLTLLPGHSSRYYKSSCEKVAVILAIKNQSKIEQLV